MKAAQVADYRRHLTTKVHRWSTSFGTFSVAEVPSLGSIDVPFTSPFTVLCGPNGVGKSTLLTALRATLDGNEQAHDSSFGRKLRSGGAFLSLQIDRQPHETEVSFNNGAVVRASGEPRSVIYINTGDTIFSLQESMCKFDSREDLLNGAGTKELVAEEIEEVNYILRRDYRRIAVSEVELEQIAPYFEVSYGDDDYDSRTMGAGELAALYLWWRIKSAPQNSIILVEEPETFLSPATQEVIGNFLVAEAFDHGHCVTITSHSGSIISPLPKDSLKFFYRAGGALRLAERPTPALLESIGIMKPVSALFFVEDEAAQVFLRLLLEHVDPLLSTTIAIVVRNGHGGIKSALSELSGLECPFRFIGMFDGDMRDEADLNHLEHAMFLPGQEPIETVFRLMVKADPEQLASMRGAPQGKIDEILYGAEGADHHDWYRALCKGLGLTMEQLLSTLFVLWQRTEVNAEAIKHWHASVLQKLGQ